jgi:hypothetical protein
MEPFVSEYINWLEGYNRQLFHQLMEYSSSMNHRLKVSFFFNAYQPRCNRMYKETRGFLRPTENPFIDKLYEKIKTYEKESNVKRKEEDNLIAIALTDCYIPLLSISEMFPKSISIVFPQVTVDYLKLRYPLWHQKLKELVASSVVDLGISSYHHCFAPLLTEKLLIQEYSSALEAYFSHYQKKETISLHIPECAISPTLLDSLAQIQNVYSVSFITVLDSDYHNKEGIYDIGKVNEIIYYSKGIQSKLKILFSNNHFSRRLFSFPPSSDWKTLGFWYFTRMFESIAKPQPYPYWENLKSGDSVRFIIHTDAETIGFYSKERIYSLYLMIHLMKQFDIDPIPISEIRESDIVKRETIQPLLYRTWDMETSGDSRRWIKEQYDSSTQFFFVTKEIYPFLIDLLVERQDEMSSTEKKILQIARYRYANALTSCPHWWSEPDSIAGKQFARDVIQSGRMIRKLERYVPEDKKEILRATERLEEHPFVKRALKS